ncbi:MAG TPA: ABC transporter ATP-binding protein, partial [Candidatus Krumholzibacteria bacterium]|nr:ABC transporter ATP-binding protein [Candidatus Krumholzibacteria bacterium]
MIDVRSVTKRFGRVVAVNEVSFHVSAGEAVALWGHNGAGKTTILRCLLGVTSFDGAIDVDGVDVGRDGRRARTRVGFVPQDVHFYHHLTVRETLALFRRIRGVGQRRDAELLAELELEEHARKPVRELSGGMRQRLALAVALLPDPPILLLDEPTSNLDESSRARFFSSLMACKEKGTTIVFSSHRTEEVSWLADRVLVLEGGSVVSESAPREAVTPPARLM